MIIALAVIIQLVMFRWCLRWQIRSVIRGEDEDRGFSAIIMCFFAWPLGIPAMWSGEMKARTPKHRVDWERVAAFIAGESKRIERAKLAKEHPERAADVDMPIT